MPEKLKPSYKFNETQLAQLKQIVPEAFKDGMLDFNSLYDALKDYNEEERAMLIRTNYDLPMREEKSFVPRNIFLFWE